MEVMRFIEICKIDIYDIQEDKIIYKQNQNHLQTIS